MWFFLHTEITKEELTAMYPPIVAGNNDLISGELLMLDGVMIVRSERL